MTEHIIRNVADTTLTVKLTNATALSCSTWTVYEHTSTYNRNAPEGDRWTHDAQFVALGVSRAEADRLIVQGSRHGLVRTAVPIK